MTLIRIMNDSSIHILEGTYRAKG